MYAIDVALIDELLARAEHEAASVEPGPLLMQLLKVAADRLVERNHEIDKLTPQRIGAW